MIKVKIELGERQVSQTAKRSSVSPGGLEQQVAAEGIRRELLVEGNDVVGQVGLEVRRRSNPVDHLEEGDGH
ncbi:hypothetical protein SAMN05216228_1003325 [Rhizobium tibeticum]|uniref:Uncharacterized protein n=1 Tax=Rhizobium tibeticum TaxID=501024 RepID=A0A1H8FJ20_9HYPH|nr:hypothetical protein RTCCBAU85039_0318 [Rhizobium tibeticum]SEN31709.1 hypothetical protein SAMN05216228_1003325 [Rhizobium tibeticum]